MRGACIDGILARAGIGRGAGGPGVNANNVQAIQQLREPVKGIVVGAFTHALNDVFLVGVPFILVALVVSLFLKELPLRTGPAGPAAPGRAAPGAGGPDDAEVRAGRH